jgi:hypothetical protein
MSDRAVVRNGADPQQVRRGRRREHQIVEQRAERLRFVLQTALGRAALWDLLEDAGVYRSIMADDTRIFWNAGRHDFGLKLLGRVIDADEHAYLAMEAEARQRKRRDNQQIDAAHTASATAEGQDDGGHSDRASDG